MKFRRIIPATMLTLALAVGSCGTVYAGGRTSDEVIRKAQPKPYGYDGTGQKKNYDQYEMNAKAIGAYSSGSSTTTTSSAPASNIQSGFSFSAADYTMNYLKHEVSQDYKGNPCVLYYFTFTNTGTEATSAMAKTLFTFYQNGVQCDLAVSSERNEEMDNYSKKVMPGTSINVCTDYVISDYSDVTVEIKEFLKDNKGTQVLSLK
jgi:hypothetical protein